MPLLQIRDLHSAFAPQAAPVAQFGEQAGARQVPFVQTRELQSPLTPQAAPSLQ